MHKRVCNCDSFIREDIAIIKQLYSLTKVLKMFSSRIVVVGTDFSDFLKQTFCVILEYVKTHKLKCLFSKFIHFIGH